MKKLRWEYYLIGVFFLILGGVFVSAGDVIVKNGELNVTQNFFVDTNTLFVDSTNNRVGIGTSSPSDLLDVNGWMVVRSSGDVGIGISAPAANLHVVGNSTLSAIFDNPIVVGTTAPLASYYPLTLYEPSTASNAIVFANTNTGLPNGANGAEFGISGTSMDEVLWNFENAGILFGTNNAQRMYIDSSGKVGIGVTSPNSTLHIVAGGTTLASSWDVYSDPSIKANLAEQNINNFDFSTAKLYSYNLRWSETNITHDENGDIVNGNTVDKISDRTQLGLASNEVPQQCVRNAGGYDAVDTYCLLSLAYVKIAQLESRLTALGG